MTTTTLETLGQIIKERRQSTAEKSYTKSLIEAGTGKCCKKLGEEATEMIIAALSEDEVSFKEEAADVLYHYLVLLEAKFPLPELLCFASNADLLKYVILTHFG